MEKICVTDQTKLTYDESDIPEYQVSAQPPTTSADNHPSN